MNDELKLAFDELKKDIDFVHMKWKIYKQLYGSGKERHDLLNEMAGGFFVVIHASLFSDILISIGRLTDPSEPKRFHNLSLEKIVSMIDVEKEPNLSSTVQGHYDRLEKVALEIREIRNKQLAHTDVKHRLGENTLPSMNRRKVEDALEPIRHIMNTLEEHFYDSHRAYDMPIIYGDGDTIITHLERAKEHKECIRKKLAQGRL